MSARNTHTSDSLQDEPQDDSSERPASHSDESTALPDTTDEQGRPVDNPSG